MTLQEFKERIKRNLEFVDKIISSEKTPSPEDVDGIIGHGMEMAASIGLCAKNMADAKELLAKRELEFMNDNRDLWDKPTILKKMIDATLAEENALVTWSDRLMSAYTHKMDFYRSVVSKHKEELKMNQQINQSQR